MLWAMLIGFIGGIVFLAGILLFFWATVSRKWISADFEATNWDESIDQSRGGDNVALHHLDDCCQECQQLLGSQISNDYSASSRR